MTFLVTGSSGHLGEALVRVLSAEGHAVIGLDILASPSTSVVGSIADRDCVRRSVAGADAIVCVNGGGRAEVAGTWSSTVEWLVERLAIGH